MFTPPPPQLGAGEIIRKNSLARNQASFRYLVYFRRYSTIQGEHKPYYPAELHTERASQLPLRGIR